MQPRVAVVGSGPSGFFAADALFRALPEVQVDMFERFPVPFGLVRHGVAPDQDKIKSVVRAFARIAGRPHFEFFGNVEIGTDLTVEELHTFYDAVILATGAVEPRQLGIPGEELPGSHTSTEFVGWYNGHPEFSQADYDFSHERAVVVGNGNVALDVARVLAKGAEGLRHTDIPAYALEALAESQVREIVILGRRGPVQCRFTMGELRALREMDHVQIVYPTSERQLSDTSRAELDGGDPMTKRVYTLLEGFEHEIDPASERRIVFRFLRSPLRLEGDGKLERIVLMHNRLAGEPGSQWPVETGETETIETGLVVACLGYRGVRIPGLPFDEEAGIIPNRDGRVLENDEPLPGFYVSGWIKHHARGVIGDTKFDSAKTVESLVRDLPTLPKAPARTTEALTDYLASKDIRGVDFDQWEQLDLEEISRGESAGKKREKFTHIGDMLSFLEQAAGTE